MELNEYLLKIKQTPKTTDIDLRVIMAAMDRDVSLEEFEQITIAANQRVEVIEQ